MYGVVVLYGVLKKIKLVFLIPTLKNVYCSYKGKHLRDLEILRRLTIVRGGGELSRATHATTPSIVQIPVRDDDLMRRREVLFPSSCGVTANSIF